MSAHDVFPYLNLLYEQGGSDMYFSVGAVPQMKVEGVSRAIGKKLCLLHRYSKWRIS